MSNASASCMKNVVVKASAGTGKTSRLVDQYLVLLGLEPANRPAEGLELTTLGGKACRPEDIVAVTFTRKAAAELKDRLGKALYRQGYADADKVEGAYIGTVHGICLRILQEYALEAGISPVAEELAEEDEQIMFRQAVSPIMERYARLSRLFSEFGLEPRSFSGGRKRKREDALMAFCRDLVSLARVNGKSADDLRAFGHASWLELEEQIEALATSVTAEGSGEISLDLMKTDLQVAWREQKEEANYAHVGQRRKTSKDNGDAPPLSGNEKKHLDFVRQLPISHMRWKNWLSLIGREGGAKGNLPDFVAAMEEIGRKVFVLPEFREDAEYLVTQMFAFAAEAMECFSRYKQSAGVVDFSDMERMACDALENPAVRERLNGRFRVLFVDEFQDTSPIQLRIFQLLRGLLSCTEERPGCVIFVGDDKQSIYGFRGADSELTRSCTPAPQWSGVTLPTCYRSLPEICTFTNRYFSAIHDDDGIRTQFLDGADELTVKSWLDDPERAEEKRAMAGKVPSLHFWLTGRSRGRLTVQEKLDSLARQVAVMCGRLDRNGKLVRMQGNRQHYCVPDKDRGGAVPRAVTPGDIAILCRSNKDCMGVASALEALGIRACLERDGLLEHPAVSFCLAACRLALDTGDSFSAAELHKAVHGGEGWFDAAEEDARAKAAWRAAVEKGKSRQGEEKDGESSPSESRPVARLTAELPFFHQLCQVHSRLPVLSPAEFLDAVLDAAQCFRRAASAVHPEEHLANLERLRSLVREYERAMHSRRASASPQGWLDWLDEREPGQASGGEDAVQVWTYHQSKGLARSVVILFSLDNILKVDDIWKVRVANLAASLSDSAEQYGRNPLGSRELSWWPNIFQAASKLPPVRDFFDAARATARARARAEALRLLYVGMTRAEHMLVLTGGRTSKGELSAAWLTDFFCEESVDASGKTKKTSGSEFNDILGKPAEKPARSRKKKEESSDQHGDEHPDPLAESWDGRAAELLGCSFRVRLNFDICEKPCQPEDLSTDAETGSDGGACYPKVRPRVERTLAGPEKIAAAVSVQSFASAVPVGNGGKALPRKELGNMVHAWLNLAFAAPCKGEEREKRLTRFCGLWNRGRGIWPEAEAHLPAMADRLHDFIRSRLDADEEAVFFTEWPLIMQEETEGCTRLAERRLDLMVEVRRYGQAVRWMVIDHKCGDYSACTDDDTLAAHLTGTYGGQMAAYLAAMGDMGRPCECWLHLPFEGKMLEMRLLKQGV